MNNLDRPPADASLQKKLAHLVAMEKEHKLSGTLIGVKDSNNYLRNEEVVDLVIEITHRSVDSISRIDEIPHVEPEPIGW